MDLVSVVIGAVFGAPIGFGISFVIMKKGIEKKGHQILKDALVDVEVVKKEKIIQAKEKFLQLKENHEKSINERNQKVLIGENRVKQKEQNLNNKLKETNNAERSLDAIRNNLSQQLDVVTTKQDELGKLKKVYITT